MAVNRRQVLAATAGVGAGIIIADLLDGEFDTPYIVGAKYVEWVANSLEPGEDVPSAYITSTPIPNDYQDHIDPSIDADLDEIRSFEYKKDLFWEKPETYLESEVGDCDDYALTAASILEHEDKAAKIVLGTQDGRGHMIAEDRDGLKYSVGEIAPQEELDNWEPYLEFSLRNEMQRYTEETP